jgi:cytochrome c oxidase cbb3-type subunit 1
MYVVRALGGALFLAGALIMCYNLWKTVTSVDEKSTARSAVPAE